MAENSDSESSSYDSLSEHGHEIDTSGSGNENENTNTFISDNDHEGDDQHRLIPGFLIIVFKKHVKNPLQIALSLWV
jgi:hypothetical protein